MPAPSHFQDIVSPDTDVDTLVSSPGFLERIFPSLERLAQDRAAWDALSPAEQNRVITILRSIPTPPERGAAISAGLAMVDFFQTKLGWKPTDRARRYGYTLPITPDQQLIVESVEKHKRTAVTSGHGVGKTRISAAIAIAFLNGAANRKVVTTATTWDQVENQLWAEIRAAYANAPEKLPGRVLTTKVEIAPGWYMSGLSTRDYAKFSGFHAPGGVLVVIDEATGVLPEVASAAESLILGPQDRLLAIGNPTDPASWFKEASENSALWHHIVVSCYNHPNVIHNDPYIIPGAVTKEWVEDQELALGKDSPLFFAKVLGRWPDSKQDALIHASWILAAQTREAFEEDFKGTVIGCDVAGPGGDLLTIWKITNRKAALLAWRQKSDYMHGVGLLVRFAIEHRARAVVVDDTGVGGAVTSRLREIKRSGDPEIGFPDECKIIPVNFGSTAPSKHSYNRYKDQIWWSAREILRAGSLNLPTDAEIRTYGLPKTHSFLKQLQNPIYRLDSTGRVDVYDQRDNHDEETKLLPAQSPDLAHGFILACWGWLTLREDRTPAPPKDVVEATMQQFHSDMKKRVDAYHKSLERRDLDDGGWDTDGGML